MPIALDQSVARTLEETFDAALTAAPALVGVHIFKQLEDVATQGASRLPAVIISATAREERKELRVNGVSATGCEISFECRAAGNVDGGAESTEDLAAKTQAAIESATGITGWQYLSLDFDGEETGAVGATRTHTLKYTALVLPV